MTRRTLFQAADFDPDQLDDWLFVDCRFSINNSEQGYRDYLEAHIPGARYAHLDLDLSGAFEAGITGRHPLPKLKELNASLCKLGIHRESKVVAYDDMGGAIAARLWWLLYYLGHEDTYVLDGGWSHWLAAGMPTARGEEPSEEPGNFAGLAQPELVADALDVLAVLEDPKRTLIDARAAKRYLGEEEHIDPIAGHIPGAVNMPFTENLGEDRTFLSPQALRERYATQLAGFDTQDCIVYCGSGVTAAHHVLAMVTAGLCPAKLYVGSWSDWITDPSRPVVPPRH
ncbi:sulfurtransferase [Acanthopleuribacter pedis]|uniref:Sulfurtransferase n=1 Tax=Acanthopleuribacter pedis TaxID=442870 RepID=A0A8J7QDB4_9BACT|nr:sulfurtransferase [Acanthopleuribacter pedis]MBO1316973.1 sulfurtransferase [Acanthopleuribacter pedis]